MNSIDERPSILERYSSATNSSNLKLNPNRQGDADLMILAGWCNDSLGASLVRLKTEFDSVRAQLRGSANDSATEKMLVLMGLNTLRSTKDILGQVAKARAARTGFARPAPDIHRLAGRVLDIFLDPNCSKCDGRGFTGGGRHEESGPQIICRPCGGTGKRRGHVGKDDEERRFADGLLADIESKASGFEQKLARRARA